MKKLLLSLAVALCAASAFGQATLCNAVTATGACAAVQGNQGGGTSHSKTYQASGATSAGAGSCVMPVQGSNDAVNYDTIGTITLTLSTTSSSDSFTSIDRYTWVRGNPTTLTGTNAYCTLRMGY
jgi:hypothetical protein